MTSQDTTCRDLDPGMLHFNQVLASRTPAGYETWPLEKQRASWNALCQEFRSPRPASLTVTDMKANGVPCRLYMPEGQRPKPVVMYGHGGGWVLGGFDTHDDICADLAEASGCAVLLMDYRLAPEHPFPAQLEDSLMVWHWLCSHGAELGLDNNNMVAAGDSAGGQMSVALALSLREQNLPQLKAMLLLYPVLGADMNTPSYVRNANAASLSRAEMEFYLNAFLGPETSSARSNEKALPLLAKNLEGLPSAFITVAGHDPLEDDGLLFHDKLMKAGVHSTLRREPALAHSYLRARHHSVPAMASFKAIAEALRQFTK
jgi:acetyl esterase